MTTKKKVRNINCDSHTINTKAAKNKRALQPSLFCQPDIDSQKVLDKLEQYKITMITLQ